MHHIPLGSAGLSCLEHNPGSHDIALVNLHENEAGSIQAGRQVMSRAPANLFHFRSKGTRTITFELGARSYTFDPNRMFSPSGIAATLTRKSGEPPPEAVAAVSQCAADFIEAARLRERRWVIALHNTGDEYSVLSYKPGGDEAGDAAEVHIDPHQHRHDFFYVTSRDVFHALKAAGYNAVLQKQAGFNDDGSLSLWCTRNGVPYINVEARYEAAQYQAEMLLALFDIVGELP